MMRLIYAAMIIALIFGLAKLQYHQNDYWFIYWVVPILSAIAGVLIGAPSVLNSILLPMVILICCQALLNFRTFSSGDSTGIGFVLRFTFLNGLLITLAWSIVLKFGLQLVSPVLRKS